MLKLKNMCLVVALICSGCTTGCDKLLVAESQASIDKCKAEFPFSRATIVSRTKCITSARHIAPPLSANQDLVNVYEATALVLAEKFQKGQITEAEYNLEIAKTSSQLYGEGERRMINERAVAAQETAASPRPVTCQRFGNMVNCY